MKVVITDYWYESLCMAKAEFAKLPGLTLREYQCKDCLLYTSFRYAGIPTLQYGPANLEGVHAYNETVDVQDVINAAKVYIGAITDYLG